MGKVDSFFRLPAGLPDQPQQAVGDAPLDLLGRHLDDLCLDVVAASPESNGMCEAFVKTFKRNYLRIFEQGIGARLDLVGLPYTYQQ